MHKDLYSMQRHKSYCCLFLSIVQTKSGLTKTFFLSWEQQKKHMSMG